MCVMVEGCILHSVEHLKANLYLSLFAFQSGKCFLHLSHIDLDFLPQGCFRLLD